MSPPSGNIPGVVSISWLWVWYNLYSSLMTFGLSSPHNFSVLYDRNTSFASDSGTWMGSKMFFEGNVDPASLISLRRCKGSTRGSERALHGLVNLLRVMKGCPSDNILPWQLCPDQCWSSEDSSWGLLHFQLTTQNCTSSCSWKTELALSFARLLACSRRTGAVNLLFKMQILISPHSLPRHILQFWLEDSALCVRIGLGHTI